MPSLTELVAEPRLVISASKTARSRRTTVSARSSLTAMTSVPVSSTARIRSAIQPQTDIIRSALHGRAVSRQLVFDLYCDAVPPVTGPAEKQRHPAASEQHRVLGREPEDDLASHLEGQHFRQVHGLLAQHGL